MNKLKQVLKEQGRTQLWLSEQLGITSVTVNYWCQNSHQPSLKTLEKIATILQIDKKELI